MFDEWKMELTRLEQQMINEIFDYWVEYNKWPYIIDFMVNHRKDLDFYKFLNDIGNEIIVKEYEQPSTERYRETARLSTLGIFLADGSHEISESFIRTIKYLSDQFIKNPHDPEFSSTRIFNGLSIPKEHQVKVEYMLKNIHFWKSLREEENGSVFQFSQEIVWYENIENINDYIEKYFERYIPARFQKDYGRTKLTTTYPKGSYQTNPGNINKNPYFKNSNIEVDIKLCFVLMPISTKWSDRIYKKYIREAVEGLGLQCLRADNLHGQIVMEDIWTYINKSAFVIVDVTDRNPNVMYELGIVHSIGVPSILITQDLKDIPFDLKHLRHYQYEDTSDGKDDFKKDIPDVIRSIYNENYPENMIF